MSARNARNAPVSSARVLPSFYSLRRPHVIFLQDRSKYPKVVRPLLGHVSIVQTMDTYSHLLEDIGGDAVGGLDEASG